MEVPLFTCGEWVLGLLNTRNGYVNLDLTPLEASGEVVRMK